MTLVEQIKSTKAEMNAHDFCGDGYSGYTIGFSEATDAAVEIAKQYDAALAEIAELAELVISLQMGAFASEDGACAEINVAADAAEQVLLRLSQLSVK